MAISYSNVLGWEECEVDTASFWKKGTPRNQIIEIEKEKEKEINK